jgi:hypothetical protein
LQGIDAQFLGHAASVGLIATPNPVSEIDDMISRIAAGAILGLALTTAASAQSYNAPAGIPAVTAPGGLVGIAGPGNVERYLDRDGRHGTVSVDGVYTTGSTVRGARTVQGR